MGLLIVFLLAVLLCSRLFKSKKKKVSHYEFMTALEQIMPSKPNPVSDAEHYVASPSDFKSVPVLPKKDGLKKARRKLKKLKSKKKK